MPDAARQSLDERVRQAVLPQYALDRRLAEGGMGIVYLARDVRLDRLVAIKILRPELATASAMERFVREARCGR
jgi:eukaryotic-like serine/threonine-protein kinase